MLVSRLVIENYRGVKEAVLNFDGHALLIGMNNVGKSTICEALEIALSPERLRRFPVVDEFDFYNARYLDEEEVPIPIKIEVWLTDLTATIERTCNYKLERWNPDTREILGEGAIEQVDNEEFQWCLRILAIARYNKEEDEFEASTHFASQYDPENEVESRISWQIKRTFGFLYLRALRTGSRALSLERGSLLDLILRIQSMQTGLWEQVRRRLSNLIPPIDEGATQLTSVLQTIESRLAEYIPMDQPGNATRLFVSQLTREHLRKTLSFFVSITADQSPVPFQRVGTGTLNTLVFALLSFVAELKEENVIFAMEEPEIALPPHTQRRIADYLIENTTQCFVTSHSPYVIERFDPDQVLVLQRTDNAKVTGTRLVVGEGIKAKTYRKHIRRGLAECMLGRAVIVVEGFTEQLALNAVAEKMESANSDNYPLDLSGVSIFSADGDGSIAEFGRFFISLELQTFAFFDRKDRTPTEQERLDNAGFTLLNETPFKGMEALLAEEVPSSHQWRYLEGLRDEGLAGTVPRERPDEAGLRELTQNVLKDGKGWGRAAELIDFCRLNELPPSITSFLTQLYEEFQRPESVGIAANGQEEGPAEETDQEPSDRQADGNESVPDST